VSAFIVERGTPGLSLGKPDRKMGQRGAHTCDVVFEDCRVPADRLIGGKEGVGFKTAMKVLDKGPLHIAAVCVGAAERMLSDALGYALERRQFGQPIAEFQLVQAMLADMIVDTEAARGLVWKAGWLKDTGKPSTTETSIAKLYATEAAVRNANLAIQVHGGSGYVDDHPVERYLRDARVATLYEGTSQIQKLIIGRAATGINAMV
jgi:acyl-CoA dehydrogenase